MFMQNFIKLSAAVRVNR